MYTSCTEYRALVERHIDGSLGEAESAELRAHAETCEGCRRELAWLDATGAALERLGENLIADAPAVDVRSAVMEAVHSGAVDEKVASAPTVTPFPVRRKTWPRVLAVAAALLLAALGLFYLLEGAGNGQPVDVAQDPPTPSPTAPEGYGATPEIDANGDPIETARTPEPPQEVQGENFETQPPGPRPRAPRTTTPMTAVEAYRAALAGGGASNMERLSELAALTMDTARALAQDPDASADTLLGAALHLPPEEATEALEAAVAMAPESPALRYHLARNYAETGQDAAANEQLAQLKRLDPNNAMPDFLQAQSALESGNNDAALAALKTGNATGLIDPYTVANAVAQESALIAAGTDPEVARMLTAFTMGRTAYDDLTGLASSFLDVGAQLASEQSISAATSLLEAVLQFGTQVETNSEYIQERQAGLDIQQAALDQLAPLVTSQGDAEALQDVSAAASHLVTALGDLTNYMNNLQQALTGVQTDTPEPQFWQDLANIIYQQGDLNLLGQF